MMRHRAFRRAFAWAACIALHCTSVAAQSVVFPQGYTNSFGTSPLVGYHFDSVPITIQCGIHASELTTIPKGSILVGLSYRLRRSATAPWPPTAAHWNNYEITLGEGALPTKQWSPIFANNMKNAVLVRKGPMTVPANMMPISPLKPNPFDDHYAEFQQPYVYRGGDLVILTSHDGSNVATTPVVDAISQSNGPPGRTMLAASFRAQQTIYLSRAVVITRIHYGHGPAVAPGANGSLTLVLSNNLVGPTPPPGPVQFSIVNGVSGAAGEILFSFTRAVPSLPLLGGNHLLVLPPFPIRVPFVLDAGGRFDLPLNVGYPSAAIGLEAQAYALDASNPAGFVASNAVSFLLSP